MANKRYKEEMLGLTDAIVWEDGDTASDSHLSAKNSHFDETSLSPPSNTPNTEWNAARNSLPNKALEDLDLDAVMLYDFAYPSENPDHYRYTLNSPDNEDGLTFVNERSAEAWPHFHDDDKEVVDTSTEVDEKAKNEGEDGSSGEQEEDEDDTSDEEGSEDGSSSNAGSGDEAEEGEDDNETSSGESFETDKDVSDNDLKPLVRDHSPHEEQSAPSQSTVPAPHISTASDEDMLV